MLKEERSETKTMDGEINVGKVVLQVVGVILGILIIWVIVASAIWGFSVATAGIFGRGEQEKQIQSADYRRAAYESFYDQKGSIEALERQIDDAINQLQQMEKGTTNYDRVLTNLSGLKGMRHTAIQKYNADAQKEFTAGRYRPDDLPFKIEDTEYPPKGGNK